MPRDEGQCIGGGTEIVAEGGVPTGIVRGVWLGQVLPGFLQRPISAAVEYPQGLVLLVDRCCNVRIRTGPGDDRPRFPGVACLIPDDLLYPLAPALCGEMIVQSRAGLAAKIGRGHGRQIQAVPVVARVETCLVGLERKAAVGPEVQVVQGSGHPRVGRGQVLPLLLNIAVGALIENGTLCGWVRLC